MGSRVETPTWLGSSHQWPWWHSPPQLLSSRATPATPSSCRGRDLTLVLENLEQHTHRKMELCSERSLAATMRGLDSTATSTTLARPSLCSTLLASMDSGSSRETTSRPEVRTPPWLPRTPPGSRRSTTTSTTMTVNPSPSLSTPMTLRITLSTFWTGTLPGTWLAASSPHLPPDLFGLLTTGGRTSHQARSSWIGSLKVSTLTSGLSRAEPTKLQIEECVFCEKMCNPSIYFFLD